MEALSLKLHFYLSKTQGDSRKTQSQSCRAHQAVKFDVNFATINWKMTKKLTSKLLKRKPYFSWYVVNSAYERMCTKCSGQRMYVGWYTLKSWASLDLIVQEHRLPKHVHSLQLKKVD